MFRKWSVDKLIIVSTTLFVLAEIIINFITSYGHIDILGLMYGESGTDAALTPIGIDLALFVFAELNLFLARHGRSEYRWPRWVLGGGVTATVAANLAYGAHWGFTGAAIAAFSAVALFFTVEGGMLLLKVAAEEREKNASALLSGPPAAIPVTPPKAAPWETEALQAVPNSTANEPEGKAVSPSFHPEAWGGLDGIGLRNRGQ